MAVDSEMLVTGSWLPANDGSTMQIADPQSLEVSLRVDAGPVLAVALADVDHDGATDILTGTQDGWLRAWDTDGGLIFEWSAGDLNLGENGALQIYEGEAQTLVAVAVTGGWRVLEIR